MTFYFHIQSRFLIRNDNHFIICLITQFNSLTPVGCTQKTAPHSICSTHICTFVLMYIVLFRGLFKIDDYDTDRMCKSIILILSYKRLKTQIASNISHTVSEFKLTKFQYSSSSEIYHSSSSFQVVCNTVQQPT